MHQVLNEKIPYFSDDGLSCAESTLRYLLSMAMRICRWTPCAL